jgi:hypothetical protein
MSILSNSWAQHLKSLAGNDGANKNMMAFTEALAAYKTTSKRIDALIKEVEAAVLLVGPKNLVQQTHSWTKFGGTRSHPNFSIACLIGAGPRANAVTIYHTLNPIQDRYCCLQAGARPQELGRWCDSYHAKHDHSNNCCHCLHSSTCTGYDNSSNHHHHDNHHSLQNQHLSTSQHKTGSSIHNKPNRN